MAWIWVWDEKRNNNDIKIFDLSNWKVGIANCRDED